MSDGFRLGLFYTIVRPEEKAILAAAEARGVAVDRLDDAEVTFGLARPERLPDVVLNRSVSHTRALYAALAYDHYGVPTVNAPAVVELAGDKVRTSLRLAERGIPTPRTVVALSPEAALKAVEEVGYPAVLKPAVGSWGRLMAKVDDAESAEQIELMYGDRYKDFTPLSDVERQDILRAEIGFALAEDTIGLGRFREKYAAKMAETPDARAFEIVSAPLGTSGAEFGAIAHAASSVDTLDGFLREMKTRYPDNAAASSKNAAPPSLPGQVPPAVSGPPPATKPATAPTASAPATTPAGRAAGQTASLN